MEHRLDRLSDSNGNQQVDAGEQIIRTQPAFNSNDTMTSKQLVCGGDLQSYGLCAHLHGRHDQHRLARRQQLSVYTRCLAITASGSVSTEKSWSGNPTCSPATSNEHVAAARPRLQPHGSDGGTGRLDRRTLGLANMEALAMSSTGVASPRSLAAIEASSLAAAMHANPGYWQAGVAPPSSLISSTATDPTPRPPCTLTGASSCARRPWRSTI